MTEFRISVELGHLLPPDTPVNADVFPTLASAVKRVAETAHGLWVSYASGAPLPDGKVINNRTGEYQRSIMLRETGPFSAVVESDLAYAKSIEEGSPARDMKRMLTSSLKVRISERGDRYLIIPFRWNHPGSVMGQNMPVAVHNWWSVQKRASSSITGTYRRVSGTGALDIHTHSVLTVAGWRYQWGKRLGGNDLANLGINPSHGIGKQMAGMVNFRRPGGTGGSSHSQFITFRVMSERSVGKWIVPAQPGKWPARTVAQQLQPIAEQAFAAAVEEDIRRVLEGK
jgi:hypothetical protein